MSPQSAGRGRPAAALPAEADVVVVGGGVVGLCTAYELSLHGREVLVIDKGPIARGSASGNAGFIAPSHVIPMAAPGVLSGVIKGMLRRTGPVVARPSLDPAYLRWIVRFMGFCNRKAAHAGSVTLAALGFRSAELVARWIADAGIDCGYRPDGLLHVYGTRGSFEAGKLEAAEMQRYGVGIEMFGTKEIRELEPSLNEEVIGGFLCTDDAGLDPARFLTSLAAVLDTRTVTLVPDTELLAIHSGSGVVQRLVTSGGDVAAGQVVVATGAWAPGVASLLGESLPVQPGKGHSMTVARPDVGPRRNILIGDRWVAVNPMGDRLRMSGWLELGRLDTRPSLRRLARVEAGVRSRIQLDPDLRVLERWAGLRPITPDGIPIIGRSRRWDNVAYAVGHGKLGLSLGPVTGRIVAQLLCDLPTDLDLKPFSPARFG
ncbi:MAG: FAD-dependent oxidoreductase [bacterium]|nr:FAD-dependent oxidoreductase [bacterium]